MKPLTADEIGEAYKRRGYDVFAVFIYGDEVEIRLVGGTIIRFTMGDAR